MSAEITEIDKHELNLFGQSSSLLFQFILSEFLGSYQEMQKIENTYKEMESLLIKRRLLGDVDYLLNNLLASITSLTGTSIIDTNAFPWDMQKGSLSKLRHHCYSFVRKDSNAEDKSIVNLNICVSKAFHSALQAREVIQYLKQETQKNKTIPDYAMLYQLLDRTIDNTNRVSRLLLRILLQFANNENVIYFLLRNRERFDQVYHTAFVKKIFKKMYPEGAQEVGRLLMQKYSERGFNNLLNTIAEKIALLEVD